MKQTSQSSHSEPQNASRREFLRSSGQLAAGSALAGAGVVGGRDMTTEAALSKLRYLFDTGLDAAAVREQVIRNLRGELTDIA